MEREQLTLGEFIKKLEAQPQDNNIYFDFAHLVPDHFMSWRGVYRELALGYRDIEWKDGKYVGYMTVAELLEKAKKAVGAVFEGYKGGDFTMREDTPVWVSNYGDADHTQIVDVINDGSTSIIVTEYNSN